MVALITDSSLQRPLGPRHVERSTPPQLRLIRGGLDLPERDHSIVVALAVIAAVLAAVLGLRMVQGQPPAGVDLARSGGRSSATPAPLEAPAPAELGEGVHVVTEGDTLWAIAEDLAPGRDPRPVVDVLADRNGGTALRAGDLVIIPAELLAAEPGAVLGDRAIEQAAP